MVQRVGLFEAELLVAYLTIASNSAIMFRMPQMQRHDGPSSDILRQLAGHFAYVHFQPDGSESEN